MVNSFNKKRGQRRMETEEENGKWACDFRGQLALKKRDDDVAVPTDEYTLMIAVGVRCWVKYREQ